MIVISWKRHHITYFVHIEQQLEQAVKADAETAHRAVTVPTQRGVPAFQGDNIDLINLIKEFKLSLKYARTTVI